MPRVDGLDAGRSSNEFMRKVILIVILLGGCKDVPMLPTLTPYKIDIQQGNFITQDMVAKLKPGMTRSQVRFILGTPLVVDPFHGDRWDYVYLYKKGGEVMEQRRFAVIFRDDKLVRIEGDVVPAGTSTATDRAGTEKPKPAVAKPDGGASAPEKPEATKPAAAEPAPGSASTPQGAVLTTTSGDRVQSESQRGESNKAETGTEKPRQVQPQEEQGFFGRVLEKLGF